MKQEEKETIIRMTKSGYTDQQIADAICYSQDHVRRVRNQLGYAKTRGRKGISQSKIDRIRLLYRRGMSFEKIAEAVHVGTMTVSKYIQEMHRNEAD